MQIAAFVSVSMSELAIAKPDISYDWIEKNQSQFKNMLFQLGIDITMPIDVQEDVIHRNKLNKVVQCTRWVGEERQDLGWLDSPYASREAIDKKKNNALLNDLYRQRGLTV